jgi:hypothetical protein
MKELRRQLLFHSPHHVTDVLRRLAGVVTVDAILLMGYLLSNGKQIFQPEEVQKLYSLLNV